VLLALPGVADVSVQGDAVAIRTTDADATLHAWYALGRPIRGLEIGGGGLEEALLALTGEDTGAGQATGAGQDTGAASGAGGGNPGASAVLSGK
jgi:ABC-2 type transport system ATP-binding protein